MALPATDNFNRADGALGANWTGSVGNDLQISTSRCMANTSDSSMYWSADAPNAAQYSQVKLVAFGAGYWMGPVVRASATDWILADCTDEGTDFFRIEWYNANSWTVIGALYSATPAANDVVKITADGTAFKLYLNTVERCSGSNVGVPATGYGGIYMSCNGTNATDDFEVGNLVTAAAFVFQRVMNTLLRM